MIKQTLESWEAGYLPEHIIISLRKKLLNKETRQATRQQNHEEKTEQTCAKSQGETT